MRERLSDKDQTLTELEKVAEAQKKKRSELEGRLKDELGNLMPMNMLRNLGQTELSNIHATEQVFITCQTTISAQTEALRNEEKKIEVMSARLQHTEKDLQLERDGLSRLEQEMRQHFATLERKLTDSTQRLKAELEQKKADVQSKLQELDEGVERRTQSLQVRMDGKLTELREVIQDMFLEARTAGLPV
jgi:transketolase